MLLIWKSTMARRNGIYDKNVFVSILVYVLEVGTKPVKLFYFKSAISFALLDFNQI